MKRIGILMMAGSCFACAAAESADWSFSYGGKPAAFALEATKTPRDFRLFFHRKIARMTDVAHGT